MPIVQSVLALNLQNFILKEFSASLPNSTQTPYQAILARAVSIGFSNCLIGAKGTIIPTGGVGVAGIGIQGVTKEILSNAILNNMKMAFNAEGVAGKPLSDAIAEAIVLSLSQATVSGTSAGTASQFTGWTSQQMADLIAKNTGWDSTPQNKQIFLAISNAITNTIQNFGFAVIPPTGPGSGGTVAIIS